MRAICPFCEVKRDIEQVKGTATLPVRGEEIEVTVVALKCRKCNEEFQTTRGHDHFKEAYRKYRERHGLLMPEEIKDWRERVGLTQRELCGILGWGGATLSRYENGALQDEAHDKALKSAREPDNLVALIEASPDAIEEEKRKRILGKLTTPELGAESIRLVGARFFGRYDADIYSGHVALSVKKFESVVLFFCSGEGQLKTKLNKLLYYADSLHFKEHGKSITGARYAHLPHGPVPDNYASLYAPLELGGALKVNEVEVGKYVGEKYVAVAKPDMTLFSDSELKVLATIRDLFKDATASDMKKRSHQEEGYKETKEGDLISYKCAKSIRLPK